MDRIGWSAGLDTGEGQLHGYIDVFAGETNKMVGWDTFYVTAVKSFV